MTLYSKAFLETDDDSWSARPSSSLLQKLHNGEGSARWIACISPPVAIGSDCYISIGDPADGQGLVLYLPQWFMESICFNDGDQIDIDFKRSEEMPRATSLNFRMMGQSSPGLDIRDLLEDPLSQLGVLQVGQIIPVPALEGTMLVLESCEPDGIVFLDGAEIALDIVEDEPPAAPFAAAALAAAPFAAAALAADPESFDEPMAPVAPMVPMAGPAKFIPFQGVGHRLG